MNLAAWEIYDITAKQENTYKENNMILADFIKVLDTTEPIMVYLDGLEDKAYDTEKIPSWYKQLEVTNVYVDEEGLGVAIYTA